MMSHGFQSRLVPSPPLAECPHHKVAHSTQDAGFVHRNSPVHLVYFYCFMETQQSSEQCLAGYIMKTQLPQQVR